MRFAPRSAWTHAPTAHVLTGGIAAHAGETGRQRSSTGLRRPDLAVGITGDMLNVAGGRAAAREGPARAAARTVRADSSRC